MKKIIPSIVILFMAATFVTCHKEKVNSTSQKYDISQSGSSLHSFIDYPVAFTLKSSGFLEEAEKECTVLFRTDKAGSLVAGEDTIESGTSFTHDFNSNRDVSLKYIPHKAGTHLVGLTFDNGYYKKETAFQIETKEFYFDVRFTGIPERFIIDRKYSFKMLVAEETSSGEKQFNISAAIVSGAGEASVSDAVISGGGKSNVNLGENTVSFISTAEGTNTVEYYIQAPNGFVDKRSKTFDVVYPDYKATINYDGSLVEGIVSLPYNFLLNIEDMDNSTANEYTCTYRFIKGRGALKINSTDTEVGKSVPLHKDDNVVVYTGTDKGDIEIEFLVLDKYGQQRTATIPFTMKEETTALKATQYEQRIRVNSKSLINTEIQRKGSYTGKYKIMYTIEKGSGLLMQGETALTQGVWGGALANIDAIYFNPTSIGEVKISLKVTDEQSISTSNTVQLVYSVIAADFEIAPVSVPAVVNKDVASSLTYRISPTGGGVDTYTILFTQTAGTGNIKINNMDVTHGGSIAMLILSEKTISIDYTATSIGAHKMNLRFTNTSGVVRNVPVNLTAKYKDIYFSIGTNGDGLASMIEKQESTFQYRIETDEQETFKVKYTQTQGQGTMKINNTPVALNSSVTVAGAGNIALNCAYTPTVAGTQYIVLEVSNQAGTVKKIYINGYARVKDVPFTLSAVGSIPANIYVDQETYFEYKIDREYNDQFKIRYNLLSGSGTMFINNTILTNSATIPLSDNNLNFKYVPTTKGTHNIEFYVSNSAGTEKKVSLSFDANYVDIPFSVSASTSGTFMEGDIGKIHLNISSSSSDEYTVKYVSGTGSLIYNNQEINLNQFFDRLSSGTIELGVKPGVYSYPVANESLSYHLDVANRAGTTKRVSVKVNMSSIFIIEKKKEAIIPMLSIYEYTTALECINNRPDDIYEITVLPVYAADVGPYTISVDGREFNNNNSGVCYQGKISSLPVIRFRSRHRYMNLAFVSLHNITMGWTKRFERLLPPGGGTMSFNN
ncbi:MAG: TraQ conjugal transfer family protein [Bacteroidales bacterium]|jgi:hypothetical protein|nr:TraQ conjugal transfer family protein [Bacteroidales bacterium]